MMEEYILINTKTGLYLTNGDFIGKDKTKATRLDEEKAKKVRDGFNSITKRLHIEIKKA